MPSGSVQESGKYYQLLRIALKVQESRDGFNVRFFFKYFYKKSKLDSCLIFPTNLFKKSKCQFFWNFLT